MERREQLCSDQPEVSITERSLFIHCNGTMAFHGRNSSKEGSVSDSWQQPATSFPVIPNNILIKRERLGGLVEGQASIIRSDSWWSAESVTPWTAAASDTTAYLRPIRTDLAAEGICWINTSASSRRTFQRRWNIQEGASAPLKAAGFHLKNTV